ncbi:hypothetical protein SCHPADRAFT_823341 [Schizopora paradoxa]|uniref:DUF7719 domain-containing protein n=1 Tax=Schizopora paradoxa TaxID=27342 RepID=A0A0H2RXH5_9AGAM|nr:hypothetical protein SCHPADRAFT_823341 [Schizopora paradoxa]
MKSGIEEIPEDEQWRLIDQSGILSNIPKPDAKDSKPKSEEDESSEPFSPFCEEIFQSMLLIIPMSSLYYMMIIMAHRQYAQEITKGYLLEHLLTSIPLLSVFIFYTTRHKADQRMQVALTILSIISGCRLIYVVNRTNWTVIMRQCPPLGTMWVYTVVQLELGKAVAALAAVAGYVQWTGLKIIL